MSDAHDYAEDTAMLQSRIDCEHACGMCGFTWTHFVAGCRLEYDTLCEKCVSENTCPYCGEFPATFADVEYHDGVTGMRTGTICTQCKEEV